MWQCPKCNRKFERRNQAHYCKEKPETVDEYIGEFEPEIQKYLQIVRECLQEALPEATEKISWSMPTYWEGHNIIHFAANKKHIGLYPGPDAVTAFSDELDERGLKYSKGSIQIPYSKNLPCELIKNIAIWCNKTGNHA